MRSISALLVDVPAAHAAVLGRAMEGAGWRMRAVPVAGVEALSAALAHRGWEVVLFGGEGEDAVPARKALALVRLADPHLPFVAVSQHVRQGDIAAVIRGLPGTVPTVSDPSRLPALLTRELEQARMRRRVGGAHRLLLAQQAIADHLVAGLDPDVLCERVLATLGDALGWSFGAVWRPDGAALRCASVWQAPGARRAVAEFAGETLVQTFAAGQGLAGRVWAFRRPLWLTKVDDAALRAGLVTAAAFPIASGDECLGVIELYASDVRESNGEVAAMFATVGGQLAAYLDRRRVRARARRSLDGATALVVGLDVDGRVELANAAACAALGIDEDDLLGRQWFTVTDTPREAFERLLAGEPVDFPPAAGARWRWSAARDADGAPLGALGWGELVPVRGGGRLSLIAASEFTSR